MLSLDRIRSVEDPIIFGLNAFYKIEVNRAFLNEKPFNRFMDNLLEFCEKFVDIVKIEDKKNNEEIIQWLNNREEHEYITRASTITGIYSIFKDHSERVYWSKKLLFIKDLIKELKNKNVNKDEIKKAIYILETIKDTIEGKIMEDKKEYEKIISSNSLSV